MIGIANETKVDNLDKVEEVEGGQPRRRKWGTLESQRAFLIELAPKLGVDPNDMDSWYKLETHHLVSNGGEVLLKLHGASISKLLKAIFPDHPWDVLKFSYKPRNYWSLRETQLKALRELEIKLGIEEGDREAWYKVDTAKIIEVGYQVLLKKFQSSISKMVTTLYPDHKWEIAQFRAKPRNFWKIKSNQRAFLDEVGRTLGFEEGDMEAWYSVEYRDISRLGGDVLLSRFGSVPKLVASVFPEHTWDVSRFKGRTLFFEVEGNQREILLRVGAKLGIPPNEYERWYKVSTKDVKRNGGRYLLKIYGDSVSRMVIGVFPEHSWDESSFEKRPQYFWQSIENQQRFLLDLGKKLGFKEGDFTEFYKLTNKDLLKNCGSGLLEVYDKSLSAAVMTAFPDHEWHSWRFNRSRMKRMRDLEIMTEMVKWVEQQMGMTDLDGWYRITRQHFRDLDLDGMIRKKDDLAKILTRVYPDHDWNAESLIMKSATKKGKGEGRKKKNAKSTDETLSEIN